MYKRTSVPEGGRYWFPKAHWGSFKLAVRPQEEDTMSKCNLWVMMQIG